MLAKTYMFLFSSIRFQMYCFTLPGLMAFTYLGALFSETWNTDYHITAVSKQTLEAVKRRHLLFLFTQIYRVLINKA